MNAVTDPVRYGTDLGAMNPECAARTHGTYATYQRGCRCPHAREAHRVYMKRLREGRNVRRTVDACGTRRRIQALWAIGHTSKVIAAASDGRFSETHVALLATRKQVRITTVDAVRDVYRLLSCEEGLSERTKARAAAAGYVSPMRWGAGIDRPETKPEPVEPDEAADEFVDEVAVERALNGERVDLTDTELVVFLQAGAARGIPLTRLADQQGINYFGARKMLGGELTPRRAQQQRVEAELRRVGHLHIDATLAALLGVHHQTVTRARARLARRSGQAAS